eukprot:g21428.t1
MGQFRNLLKLKGKPVIHNDDHDICTQACLIVMKIISASSSRMTWAFDCTQNHRNRCSGPWGRQKSNFFESSLDFFSLSVTKSGALFPPLTQLFPETLT